MSDFDRCWPYLEPAIELYGHTHTKKDIRQLIDTGKAYFFPGKGCAFLCNILTAPTGLKSFNVWLAGGDINEIKNMVPKLEAFAKGMGCHRAIICGRRGWLRYLDGFHDCGSRMSKDLR